jgi:hypothetical protein
MIATGFKTINEEQEITVVKASDGITIKVAKDFKVLRIMGNEFRERFECSNRSSIQE